MIRAGLLSEDDVDRPTDARREREQRTQRVDTNTDMRHGSNSSRPAAASTIQQKSTRRREENTATASGPVNSIATAIPSGTRLSDK